MLQFFSNNKTDSDLDIFKLISLQKWDKLKTTISKKRYNKSMLHNVHEQSENKSRLTALQFICNFHPPLDVIQCLYNVYPEAIFEKDCNGNYALHKACMHGCSPDVVIYLVEKYPQAATKTNKKDRSPFLLACKSYLSTRVPRSNTLKRVERMINMELLSVLKILVSAAPQFCTRKDCYGLSPLDYATEANVDLCVQIYLKEQMKHIYKLGIKDVEGLKTQHTFVPATNQTNRKRRPRRAGAMAV